MADKVYPNYSALYDDLNARGLGQTTHERWREYMKALKASEPKVGSLAHWFWWYGHAKYR